MTVRGDHAIFAYVNPTQGEATLDLLIYDLTAARPTPVGKRIPLGFDGETYAGSALTDLQTVDGTIYALITQGEVFTLRDPHWTAQHVLSID